MTLSCVQCAKPLAPGAVFCGTCGAAQPAPEPESPIALSIDLATIRLFEVGTRCLLRFRVENRSPRSAHRVELRCETRGGGPLAPSLSAPIAPGGAAILTVFLVPSLGGFDELSGALVAEGRRGARFDPFPFRIGSGTGPQVQVVNIDQRSARVVDNSRSHFAPQAAPGGALLDDGEWHPIALLLDPALDPPPEAAPSPAASLPDPALSPIVRAPIDFEVTTAKGRYHLTTTLARGDLATVYGGTHRDTSSPVAVKLADDPADNDLLQAEVRTLALLTATASPQQKHLPVVLDQVRTADGRLGTVFERLDGLDLVTIRERLPGGLPERHLIWILRRALSVLGWAHSRGILHGNVEPAHIVVRPRDHNVWLVDWCWSILEPARTGQSFRCVNEDYSPPEARDRKPPLPSSDLYALGKSMIYAAGGNPADKTLPDSVDPRIQRFLKYFAYESPLGRPQDAWDMYKQVDTLRAEVFGDHQFVELVV